MENFKVLWSSRDSQRMPKVSVPPVSLFHFLISGSIPSSGCETLALAKLSIFRAGGSFQGWASGPYKEKANRGSFQDPICSTLGLKNVPHMPAIPQLGEKTGDCSH